MTESIQYAYSPSAAGFYRSDFFTGAFPQDCVSLTEEQYEALLTARGQGKVLSVGTGGTVIASDPPQPSSAQLASVAGSAALAAGITITSASAAAINGTYSLSPSSLSNINAVATYILLGGTFPGGAATMDWVDQAGAHHTFPNVAVFKTFAMSVADFVAQVSLYIDSGGARGAIPASNAITIA
jgi:hypothetical protein